MKLLLLILVLLSPVLAYGQARTADRLVDVPFSQLNTGNPPNGSVRHCITCKRQNGPCEPAGVADTTGSDAVKLGGTWFCNSHAAGAGSGNVVGPGSATDGELVLFSNASTLKRSNTLSGVPLLASGVVSTLNTTGSGEVVRATASTLTDPILVSPAITSFTDAQHTHATSDQGGQLNATNVFNAGTIPPARVISGTIVNARCLRVSGSGTIEVAAADCGIGGGGTPGGVSGNLTFNEAGAFGGIANSSFSSVTGVLGFTQQANGNDLLNLLRATDSSPTGNLLRARNAANSADLFRLGVDGVVTLSNTIVSTNISAPATPASGTTVLWTDATGKNLRAQDDAGNVSVTVRAIACSGTDKISAISSAGIPTCTADQSTSGTGLITLNALSTSDQTFVDVDDTNVTLAISSSVSTHTFTLGWTGALAKARQHAATMYTDQSNTITTGDQSFAGAASLTVPTAAGASPTASGLIAYDATSSTWEAGVNGTNRTFAFTTGSQTFTDKTLDNSTVANLRDTLLTLQDNADSTKTVNFELSGITSGTNRVVTIANANSVTVIPTTATTNQWVTHIDSAGVQQKAQIAFSNLSGTMGPTQGGTGQTAVAQGDLLYGDATNSWARLAKDANATRYLSNTGASNNPAWAQVNLTNGVTGTLSDANLSANVSLLGSAIDLSGIEATGTLAAGRFPALTGDVTTTAGSLATTIAADAVTNAKLANMATQTIKGRTTTGTGDPEDLTATQATAILNVASTTLKGLVPAPGTATGSFLRDDLTWVVPAGAGDMTLAGVQTVTGAKTFDSAKLIVGSQSAVPTAVAGAFYRDTDDSKLYWAFDGSTWGEVFVSGLSTVNLASANVTGVLPVANGGTGFSDTTFSGSTHKLVTTTGTLTSGRCAEWDASGNLVQAAAACGSGGGGSGDVVGPASATDNAIVRFDSTTGKLVQNSVVTIADTTGDLSSPGSISLTGSGGGYIELAEGAAPTVVANRLTFAAPVDVAASGLLYVLPSDTPTNGEQLTANISGTTVTLSWDAAGSGGTGDAVSVNASAATDANFVDTVASGTVPSVTWSLNTTPSPDEISISAIGAASTTEAGIITTGTQSLAGVKLLGHTAALGRLSQSFEITTGTDYGGMALNTFSTTASTAAVIDFNRSKSNAKGTQTAVAADDQLGHITFRGSDGTDFQIAASIQAQVDGAVGTGDMPGRLSFWTTADGASSATERWRISSVGHILAFTDNTYDIGGTGPNKARSIYAGTSVLTPKVVWTGSVQDNSGAGTPEGAVTAAIGSVYRRTDGGAATTLYVKESGTGNTGWVAVGGGGGSGTINSGVSNVIPKYTASTTLDDSLLSDSGTVLTYAGSGTGILGLADTDASHFLNITPGSNLTADRVFTITTGDAARTLSMGGDITTAAAFITSGANSLTLTTTGSTNVTLPTTGTLITADSTSTLTNKTFDAEATGNAFTSTGKAFIPAGGCQGTTAFSNWDLPSATPAAAACVTGTVVIKGVLDFADTSGGFSAQNTIKLPSDFTGTIDANIQWTTTATSGNVEWSVSTICTATDGTETDDPGAFNTASTVVTAAPGVANRVQTSSITSLTITGCAAGELLHVRVFRDGNDAQDTLSATARMIGLELTIRRTQ